MRDLIRRLFKRSKKLSDTERMVLFLIEMRRFQERQLAIKPQVVEIHQQRLTT